MSASAPQRRTYLGGDERRAQILRVAAQLFSERHYDAVSLTEVARQAGIARGLVNHYFGTKRDLYLDVVREMLRMPDNAFSPGGAGTEQREELLGLAVDRWLDATKRNRGTWLALAGAQGFGRDPEVEGILEGARTRITDQLIALAWGPPAEAPPELRALLSGYRGYAEAITADWLRSNRFPRRLAHELLLQGLLALIDEALPNVQSTRPRRT